MLDRRTLFLSSLALGAFGRAGFAQTTPATTAATSAPAPAGAVAAPQTYMLSPGLAAPLDPAVLGSAEAPLPGIKIAPDLYPVEVTVKREFVPGSIIIVSPQHTLYLITRKGYAIRYGVAVGKEGLEFRGSAMVGQKTEWPKWKPTQEMIERNPAAYQKYAENGMEGGPKNPLGARALYLWQGGHDTAVRIHGTIEPNSIGRSVSNGCFRMVNQHVIDLYSRVSLGAPVMVY